MARKGSGGRGVGIGRGWRDLLLVGGATLGLALGLFCAWQGWLILHAQTVADGLHAARDRAAQVLAREIADERAPLVAAIAGVNPAVAMSAPQVAVAELRRKLPQVLQIELYSGSLDEVLHANYRQFGYAKAAQLLGARDVEGAPLAQSVVYGSGTGTGDRRLSFVIPLGPPDKAVGWAWVELPFARLEHRFDTLPTAGGRLDLRQAGPQGDLRLLGHGPAVGPAELAGKPVPGSVFNVAIAPPAAFIVLPKSEALAGWLALLGIGGGVFLLYLRTRAARPAGEEDDAAAPPAGPKAAAQPALPPAAKAAARRASPAGTNAAAATRGDVAALPVDAGIFRAYDIRGVVGKTLDAGVARALGQAIGALMQEQGLKETVIGRDGRLSGPELLGGLAEGLRAAGVDVIDLGAVPTPLVYFATFHCNTGCGVVVTGSHNPPDYNGFKVVVGGETLAEAAIQDLYRRIADGKLSEGGTGGMRALDIVPGYIDRVVSDVLTERRLKVVVDAGNGIAGAVGPSLLEGIGCDVVPLYCDVDGTFPNHHPDPSVPANMHDLIDAVGKLDADLGIAFDGDGDRLGVVTRQGGIVPADHVLMLFARDVLSRQPGATVIYDVKCSSHLKGQVLDAGGSPLMWRTGHSLIKAKMRETGAELAGEMSGHFFFKERWYGFDDGLYAAARLMEILAGDALQRTPDAIFATLPASVGTPELKVAMAEGAPHRFMDKFRAQAAFDGAALTTIDGVRADWPDGWGLVRASNTTPVLVLRFEADTPPVLHRVQEVFRTQLLAVDATLKLPF